MIRSHFYIFLIVHCYGPRSVGQYLYTCVGVFVFPPCDPPFPQLAALSTLLVQVNLMEMLDI